MSYDILKNLGLDHLDASSPDFLRALERMQKDAWQSLQDTPPRQRILPDSDDAETLVG